MALFVEQVVAVQEHWVKPRSADINENVLSEPAKEELGLSEDLIRKGRPLDQVVSQVRRPFRFFISFRVSCFSFLCFSFFSSSFVPALIEFGPILLRSLCVNVVPFIWTGFFSSHVNIYLVLPLITDHYRVLPGFYRVFQVICPRSVLGSDFQSVLSNFLVAFTGFYRVSNWRFHFFFALAARPVFTSKMHMSTIVII